MTNGVQKCIPSTRQQSKYLKHQIAFLISLVTLFRHFFFKGNARAPCASSSSGYGPVHSGALKICKIDKDINVRNFFSMDRDLEEQARDVRCKLTNHENTEGTMTPTLLQQLPWCWFYYCCRFSAR